MRLFQIGFNKCATTALYQLFIKSGVKALHSSGRHWRRGEAAALAGREPQLEIARNIAEGRAPLAGLEDFQAFFDMEFVVRGQFVENFRNYADFARHDPNAKFLLNTRDRQAWLTSRLRHADGKYLRLAMKRMRLDRDGVIRAWSDDFDRHHADVQDFFAAETDRLLVFDIDRDPIKRLVRFVRPGMQLWPRHWKRHRVTDQIAAAKGWTDPEITLAG